MSASDIDHDPTLGPWNILQCRSNTQLILQLSEQNANGVVVALDIFPISGGTYPQTIFAFRNSVSLAVSFTVELESDLRIKVWRFSTGWNLIVNPATALSNSDNLLLKTT